MIEDSSTSLHLEKSDSTALKVNNNILNSWDGFWMSLEKLFVEPALQLQWIDFSFNDLKTIDAVSSARHSVPPLVLKARHLSGSAFCWVRLPEQAMRWMVAP